MNTPNAVPGRRGQPPGVDEAATQASRPPDRRQGHDADKANTLIGCSDARAPGINNQLAQRCSDDQNAHVYTDH